MVGEDNVQWRENLYSGGREPFVGGETSGTSLPLYETLSKDEGVNYIYWDTESWAGTIGQRENPSS